MRVLLICNNSLSREQSLLLPQIIQRLSLMGHDISLSLTSGGEEMKEILKKLSPSKASLIAACGDDENLNEALNGLMFNPQKDKFSLALFPTHGESFFAKEFGITDIETALQAVEGKKARLFYPVKVISPFETHYFGRFLTVGLSGWIHYMIQKDTDKKKYLSYLFFRLFKNPPSFELLLNGETFPARMVIVEKARESFIPEELLPPVSEESRNLQLPLGDKKKTERKEDLSVFVYEKEGFFKTYWTLLQFAFKKGMFLPSSFRAKAAELEIKEVQFRKESKNFSVRIDGHAKPASSLKILPSEEAVKILCRLPESKLPEV